MRCLIFLLMFFTSFWSAAAQEVAWPVVLEGIRTTFPDVPQVTPAALAARLDGPAPPVLLDVRTADEYRVSHLRGARRIDPDAGDFGALADLPRDTAVVVYCSVGYRSSALARRLRAAGFTNVANLEGSLFAWANEGRPVYRGDVRVDQVHPYNKRWGLLLRPALRAQ